MTVLLQNSLKGKNVILTGATGGLGEAIARAFWKNGANLLLIARSERRLQQLCADLSQDSAQQQSIHPLSLDLTDVGAPQAVMSNAHRIWTRMDVLINNAATPGPIGKSYEVDPQEWEYTLRLNLMVPIQLCLAAVEWMKQQRSGKIINLSGGGATSPRPNFCAYGTAKAGLVRFSETLAAEVMDSKIQVNCISPGIMNTNMIKAVLEAGPEKAGADTYERAMQVAKSSDPMTSRPAELCLFLASDSSDAITGKLISAVWDPWEKFPDLAAELQNSDVYTLRRIVLPNREGK